MPVDTQHDDYKAILPIWQKIRDSIAGEEAVKAKGALYLPRPPGTVGKDASWLAYLARAHYPAIIGRHIVGTVGAVLRKDVEIVTPDPMAAFLASATGKGQSFEDVAKTALAEVIPMSRYGVLVDVNGVGTTLVSGYTSEEIINWRSIVVDGKQVLSLVVLKEAVVTVKDLFESVKSVSYLALFLDENLAYQVQRWSEKEDKDGKKTLVAEEIRTPTMRGKPLNFIPFQFLGSTGLSPEIERPALLDMVNLTFAYYHNSADLEQSLHLVGQPTLAIIGMDPGQVVNWGSSTAVIIPDGGDIKMIEIQGAGLTALMGLMESKRTDMMALGARFLEKDKATNIAADTERMQQEVQAASLHDLVDCISRGLTQVLKWAADWIGAPNVDVKFLYNTDFLPEKMDPALLDKLGSELQAGRISRETYHRNLQFGEIIDSKITADDEIQRIIKNRGVLADAPTIFQAMAMITSQTIKAKLEQKIAEILLPGVSIPQVAAEIQAKADQTAEVMKVANAPNIG